MHTTLNITHPQATFWKRKRNYFNRLSTSGIVKLNIEWSATCIHNLQEYNISTYMYIRLQSTFFVYFGCTEYGKCYALPLAPHEFEQTRQKEMHIFIYETVRFEFSNWIFCACALCSFLIFFGIPPDTRCVLLYAMCVPVHFYTVHGMMKLPNNAHQYVIWIPTHIDLRCWNNWNVITCLPFGILLFIISWYSVRCVFSRLSKK